MEVDPNPSRSLLWNRKLFFDRNKSRVHTAPSDPSTPERTLPMAGDFEGATCLSARGGRDLSLKSLLMDVKVVDPCKATYVKDVLHPLLKRMVAQAVVVCPEDPAVFFLTWLIGHLSERVPANLAQQFRSWLQQEAEKPVSSPSNQSTTSDGAGAVPTPTSKRKSSVQFPPICRSSPRCSSNFSKQDDDAQSVASSHAEPHRDSTASKPSGLKSSESRRSSVVSFSGPLGSPDEDSKGEPTSWRERFKRRNSRVWKPPTLKQEEIVGLISKVPMFKDLTPAELKSVADVCEIRCFNQDEEIVSLGQKGGDLHVIHNGACEVSVAQHLSELQVGDWFGEQLLLKNHIASQQRIVAAEDQLTTVCVSRQDLDRFDFCQRWQQLEKDKWNHAKATATNRRRNRLPTPYAITAAVQKELLPSDMTLIKDAVRENQHIMAVLQLTEEQLKMIAQEVVQIKVLMGTNLCEEGVIGDSLFIIHEGIFEVWEEGRLEAKMRSGQSFGEVGVLAGMPSTQTVCAARNSVVWQLTQANFGAIMKARPTSRVSEYMSMLQKIPMFKTLGADAIELLADALEEVLFVKHEVIVAKGESVSKIYIVYEGLLKTGSGDGATELKRADFFGVENILQQSPQKHRVQVASETAIILTLARSTLELLLDVSFEELAAGSGVVLPSQVPASSSRSKVAGEVSKQELQHSSVLKVEMLNSPTAQTHLTKGQLNRLGVLGAGSFGLVSLEEDRETGKMYALKALSKGYCVEKDMQKMVLQERKISTMFESPFIVHLHQTFKDDQFLYFLFEPAIGGDLFEAYADHHDWFGSTVHARFFAAGATLGLEHMHSKKVIFRDLKMENVLINGNGYPLLTDMGLAKVVIGKTYTVCGTPDYIAPETLRRTGYGRGVDWWALGVLLFIMMSGRAPFDAKTSAEVYRNVVKGFKKDFNFPGSFSDDFVDVVKGLCRKKPEERLPVGPRGLAHLTEAPWFEAFDWAAMRRGSLSPPWVPPELSAEDLVRRSVEAPPVVEHVDDGTNWDDDF